MHTAIEAVISLTIGFLLKEGGCINHAYGYSYQVINQGGATFPNRFKWGKPFRRILAASNWKLNALLVSEMVLR